MVGASEVTGVSALGIDIRALLFQVANFIILLVVLRIFAYPAIVRILEQRRRTIEESLKTAADLQAQKEAAAQKEAGILKEARVKADQIINEAKTQAGQLVTQGQKTALERAGQVKRQAEQEIEQEVKTARQELRREAITLVAKATEKVAGVRLDKKGDQSLIETALKEAVQELS